MEANKVPDYARYEQLKSAWAIENPDATCIEYQAAIARIASLCGV